MCNYLRFLGTTFEETQTKHKERFEKLLSRGWKISYNDNGDVRFAESWDDIMVAANKLVERI